MIFLVKGMAGAPKEVNTIEVKEWIISGIEKIPVVEVERAVQ